MQQGKGKAKVIPQEMRDFRSDQYNNNLPQRDFAEQSRSANTQAINAMFRELIHQVLEKIKNEAQSEPLLPISLRPGIYYRRL